MNTLAQNSDAIARSLGLFDLSEWQQAKRVDPSAKKRRKQGPRDERATLLRSVISQLDVGQMIRDKKTGKWHPIHVNTKERIAARLKSPETRFLFTLTNIRYAEHFNGEETYYFTANEDWRCPLALLMFDIDCHGGIGSLQGALAYAKYLQQFFTNLYFEISTNGNGVHCYVLLEKQNWHPAQLNDLLKNKLQPYLRHLAQGFDIQLVEVKGTFPLVKQEKRGDFSVTTGQLAKLPRHATVEQLKNTTRINPIWLDSLPEFKTEKKINVPTAIRKSCGSSGGKCISEDEIAELDGHYADIAAKLIGDSTIEVSNQHSRSVVTVEDVAIWLMIAKFFTNNMNEDGSMPCARFEAMWQALKTARDISRGWSKDRNKAIRDFLFDKGWCVDVEDNTYHPGTKFVEGQAAKWKLSAELMEWLDSSSTTEERETSLATTECGEGLGIRLVCVFSLVNEREHMAFLENRAAEILDQAFSLQYSMAC